MDDVFFRVDSGKFGWVEIIDEYVVMFSYGYVMCYKGFGIIFYMVDWDSLSFWRFFISSLVVWILRKKKLGEKSFWF